MFGPATTHRSSPASVFPLRVNGRQSKVLLVEYVQLFILIKPLFMYISSEIQLHGDPLLSPQVYQSSTVRGVSGGGKQNTQNKRNPVN